MRQHVHFTRHGGLNDELLADIDDFPEAPAVAGDSTVEFLKFAGGTLVDVERVDNIQEFVASRSLNSPILGQFFTLAQDFFDRSHRVDGPPPPRRADVQSRRVDRTVHRRDPAANP